MIGLLWYQPWVSYTVYYEDTDCLGAVYYANYLKFMERGRSEFLRAHGKSVADWNKEGILIVVHALTMTFRKAASLGDLLDVATKRPRRPGCGGSAACRAVSNEVVPTSFPQVDGP